jgi:hypothetical protein
MKIKVSEAKIIIGISLNDSELNIRKLGIIRVYVISFLSEMAYK